jgi:hypothetical protein
MDESPDIGVDGKDSNAGPHVWNRVLGVALAIPGVRVDRADFLRTALSVHVPADVVAKAIETTPAKAGVERAVVERAANSSINWHRAGVTATSALGGLPGGWWIAATIPGDLTQYFFHVVVAVQKLAYLYGWPALFGTDDDIDDETKLLLTLFIGVMLGASGANAGLGKLASAVEAEVVRRLPRVALTQYGIYQVAKQVAKWIGVGLTKQTFAEVVGRAIPILGGAIMGTITWVTFSGGTDRLHKHLASLPLAAGAATPDAAPPGDAARQEAGLPPS